MIIGLDLGNSIIKMVGGEEDNLIYKMVDSLATKQSEDKLHVVDFNGEVVHFGVGEPLYETVKTNRKYLAHNIMLAAYELYGPGEHEIDLGLTLPIDLYKLAKESYQKQIESLGKLQGSVNGRKISVEVKKLMINAEGLMAFHALQPEIKKEPVLFLDMGHGTTDCLVLNVNSEGRWKLEDTFQIDIGGKQLLEALSKALFYSLKEILTVQQIEQRLTEGGKIGTIDISDYYEDGCQDVVENITHQIHGKCNDMPFRTIYCIGGASVIYNKVCRLSNLTVISDKNKLFYSNAFGSYLKVKR